MEQDYSYISLQPPPARAINDTIQFESIDLYLWTGPDFRTPSVLFYSGPVCSANNIGSYDPAVSNINMVVYYLHVCCNIAHQDFFVILLENSGVITIQWKVGKETGTASQAGFQLGFSQLHVTRYIT